MYWKFLAMTFTTAAMFVLTYLNTYSSDHIFWSETRFWMAFVMGGATMAIMLLFMWGMYKSKAMILMLPGAKGDLGFRGYRQGVEMRGDAT